MYYLSKEEQRKLRVTWSPDIFLSWGIETYNDKLVAYSVSQDHKRSLSLFCSTKGPAFVYSVAVEGEGELDYTLVDIQDGTFDFMGMPVPAYDIKIHIDDAEHKVSILLPNEFEAPKISAHIFFSKEHYIVVNPDNMEETARFALEDCL